MTVFLFFILSGGDNTVTLLTHIYRILYLQIPCPKQFFKSFSRRKEHSLSVYSFTENKMTVNVAAYLWKI